MIGGIVMKKKFKKVMSVLLAVVISLSVIVFVPIQASALTQGEVIDWMNSKNGTTIYDGGNQCVAAFNSYLRLFGISNPISCYPVSYAYQIFNYDAPGGWQKIWGSGNYQVGDVVVWDSSVGRGAGHVGMVYSTDGAVKIFDQNYVAKSVCGIHDIAQTSAIRGVFRPPLDSNNFPGEEDTSWNVPAWKYANSDLSTYNDWGVQESGRYISAGDYCYIEKVYTNGFAKVKYPLNSGGERWAYAYASGFPLDKKVVHWYDGLSPVNLGTDFYAKITTANNHRDVCNTDSNVNLYESCDEPNHVWYFIRQSDGSYKIKNARGNNNYMDVYGSYDKDTNVQVWVDNTSDGQYWFVYTKDGSNYYLRPKCSDRVLDVTGGENKIGDNIGIWSFNESAAQKFRISKVPFPYTTIGNDFYAKIITSKYGLELTATNENVDIRDKFDNPNHVWHFTLQNDNTYKIVNMYDNVLDSEGNIDSNANVITWSDNGNDCQRWYVYDSGNDNYYLKPKCADRVLDVSEANFESGANVGIFTLNRQENQQFKIQKTLYPYENIGTDFYAKITTVKNDLDVIANAGNVEISEKSNERNHIWYFHRKDDGSYKIRNLQSDDNYMDVYDSADDNVNVQIWCNNDGKNQDWFIYKAKDGNYQIKTKSSCRFLDVTKGENNVGDNVGVWTLTESGAQIFRIEKFEIGDSDFNGKVDINDVTSIQMYLAELEEFTDEQLAVADVNGDGEVDINDATYLQMYLADLVDKLG